jgi:hypothetical protein
MICFVFISLPTKFKNPKKNTSLLNFFGFFLVKLKLLSFSFLSLLLGVPMRAVNNRPQTANRYNRQPSNRLTAITVNRYNR